MHRRNLNSGMARSAYQNRFPSRISNESVKRPKADHRDKSQSHSSQDIVLISNSYKLDTNMNLLRVHEYQLSVTLSEGYKNLPVKVLARNFISQGIRKLIMDKLVPKLVGANFSRGALVIDPNLEAIYSSKPLNLKLESSSSSTASIPSTEELVLFERLLIETDLINLIRVDIMIKYLGPLDTSVDTESKLKIMTAALHHRLLESMIRYGSVYYKFQDRDTESSRQTDRLDLISQHVMGISLSGLHRSANNESLVVISCSHSYLTNSHRLIDLLASYIFHRPVQGIKLSHSSPRNPELIPEISSVRCTESWFKDFTSTLEGFKCKAEGLGENANIRLSMTVESAAGLLMDPNSASTVQEYYKQNSIYLNYPNLPCLKSKSSSHPYYPLELCTLISGQKVPMFRLGSNARNELTLLNKPKPDKSKKLSTDACYEITSINSREFENFGVKLSRTPLEARGSSLPKPILRYNDRDLEPHRDFWESGVFYQAMHLTRNWCVVNTVPVDPVQEESFFHQFSNYSRRFGFSLGRPSFINRSKDYLLESSNSINTLIRECKKMTNDNLRFIMFVIDSTSTPLNRLVHLSFDEHADITASCLRVESIMNHRQHRAIYRTLLHKLNARLGGTNVVYDNNTLAQLSLSCEDLLIIGLDVTHPDNELSGVSIVGCAYTYGKDLFRHRSLVWPQPPRTEIITKVDLLMERVVHEYYVENKKVLPKQIIIYRDGVSHEEFERVRLNEVTIAQRVLEKVSLETKQPTPILSYIIAQKRHTMRFFHMTANNTVSNPPSGTLIDQDVVSHSGREFYLYSNTSPQATARPLHYHVLLNGLGIENLQKLTYYLCFNFGKCSSTLSMPSSLRYAHNAAYDARNRVIAAREFSETRFYTSKFFC